MILKITDIKSFIVSAHNDNWVYVKVYSDEGITGAGECSLETREQTVSAAVLKGVSIAASGSVFICSTLSGSTGKVKVSLFIDFLPFSTHFE